MTGKRSEVLKTGIWSINPPHPGEKCITEGEILEEGEVPGPLFERMLEAKAIKVLKGKGPQKTEDTPEAPHVLDDVSDIRATLMDIVDNAEDKNEAKTQLEEWGKENLEIDINRGKKVEEVVSDLIAAYEDKVG